MTRLIPIIALLLSWTNSGSSLTQIVVWQTNAAGLRYVTNVPASAKCVTIYGYPQSAAFVLTGCGQFSQAAKCGK